MAGGSKHFRRLQRLRSSKDFRRLSREGRRVESRSFVVLSAASLPGDTTRARLGITVSRRVGSAVVRNRVKRYVREWFRRRGDRIPKGKDYVVIARRAARELDALRVLRELDSLLEGVCPGGQHAA